MEPGRSRLTDTACQASMRSLIAKDSDSGSVHAPALVQSKDMNVKTCAACECTLNGKTVEVKVGRETIEVCCDDCAERLKEADPSALSPTERSGAWKRAKQV